MSLTLESTPVIFEDPLFYRPASALLQLPQTFARQDFDVIQTETFGGLIGVRVSDIGQTGLSIGNRVYCSALLGGSGASVSFGNKVYTIFNISTSVPDEILMNFVELTDAGGSPFLSTGHVNNLTARENYRVNIKIYKGGVFDVPKVELTPIVYNYATPPDGNLFVDLGPVITEYMRQVVNGYLDYFFEYWESWDGGPAPVILTSDEQTGIYARLDRFAKWGANMREYCLHLYLEQTGFGINFGDNANHKVNIALNDSSLFIIGDWVRVISESGQDITGQVFQIDKPDTNPPNIQIESPTLETYYDISPTIVFTAPGKAKFLTKFKSTPPVTFVIQNTYNANYDAVGNNAGLELQLNNVPKDTNTNQLIIGSSITVEFSANAIGAGAVNGTYQITTILDGGTVWAFGINTPSVGAWTNDENKIISFQLPQTIYNKANNDTNPVMWRGWRRPVTTMVDLDLQARTGLTNWRVYGIENNINKSRIGPTENSGPGFFSFEPGLKTQDVNQPQNPDTKFMEVKVREASPGAQVSQDLYFEVRDECKNPVCVYWLNTLGAFDTWLFSYSQTIINNATPGTIIQNPITQNLYLEGAQRTRRRTDIDESQKIVLTADGLTLNQYQALREIKASELVGIWLDKAGDLVAWCTVVDDYASEYNTNDGFYTYTVILQLPEGADFETSKRY